MDVTGSLAVPLETSVKVESVNHVLVRGPQRKVEVRSVRFYVRRRYTESKKISPPRSNYKSGVGGVSWCESMDIGRKGPKTTGSRRFLHGNDV